MPIGLEGNRPRGERLVGFDHDGAFGDVRFERPLPHVAGIHEQHATLVARTRRTQVLQVTAEQRQAALPIAIETRTVQIVRADDRQRDRRRAWRRGAARRGDQADEQEHQLGKRTHRRAL